MNQQIIYILSTNYAGSHLLALQLGSHSRCASIGELHHFRRKYTRHRACHACPSDEVCPVFTGLRKQPVRGFYNTIFRNLAALDPAVTTIIDNSKKVRWAQRFVREPVYTKKYIHLIRDPRALIRRWMISFDEPAKKKMRKKTARRCWTHAWNILTGDEPNVYVWDWLYENSQITKFIRNNNLDARLVTYRDLVFKADEVLAGIMKWLDFEYEPAQKEYWKFVHHSSVKTSYMQSPPEREQVFDQRWKTYLTKEVQDRVFNHARIQSYIRSLGLVFDFENGLSMGTQFAK